jgi:hypothetical protein
MNFEMMSEYQEAVTIILRQPLVVIIHSNNIF